jgi:hypothetical protein
MMAYAWDVSIDEVTKVKNFGNAPWTPVRRSNFSEPPVLPPRPATERSMRNMQRKFYVRALSR